MKVVTEMRRAGILIQKRVSLFKYNLGLRLRRGQGYDPLSDTRMLDSEVRSMNLLDFSSKKDLFLIDEYSDSTIYGGLSETTFESENDSLVMKSAFKPDTTGLVKIDYQFCGFRCINLIQKNFEYFNGFRVLMRQPQHPVKLGVYI